MEINLDIKNKLRENKLKEALMLFSKLNLNTSLSDEVIVLSKRLAKIKSEKRKGIISDTQENIESNKITVALLEILQLLNEEEDRKEMSKRQFLFVQEVRNIYINLGFSILESKKIR